MFNSMCRLWHYSFSDVHYSFRKCQRIRVRQKVSKHCRILAVFLPYSRPLDRIRNTQDRTRGLVALILCPLSFVALVTTYQRAQQLPVSCCHVCPCLVRFAGVSFRETYPSRADLRKRPLFDIGQNQPTSHGGRKR